MSRSIVREVCKPDSEGGVSRGGRAMRCRCSDSSWSRSVPRSLGQFSGRT